MEGLYEWIRNITYYLIFMTVVENLLPNKKYEKYFRLFAGMVLILLVLKPFTGGLRLDDRLAYSFESISFQKEAAELRDELTGMEGKRLKSMVEQYEAAVETDLKSMADSAGFLCRKAEASIDGNESHDTFGHVVSVYLLVASGDFRGAEGSGLSGDSLNQDGLIGGEKAGQTTDGIRKIVPVEPVKVEVEADQEAEPGSRSKSKPKSEMEHTASEPVSHQGSQTTADAAGNAARRRQEENSALSVLRRRISEYYDLEEQDIEIQLENE